MWDDEVEDDFNLHLVLDLMEEIDDSPELPSSLRGFRSSKAPNVDRHRTEMRG